MTDWLSFSPCEHLPPSSLIFLPLLSPFFLLLPPPSFLLLSPLSSSSSSLLPSPLSFLLLLLLPPHCPSFTIIIYICVLHNNFIVLPFSPPLPLTPSFSHSFVNHNFDSPAPSPVHEKRQLRNKKPALKSTLSKEGRCCENGEERAGLTDVNVPTSLFLEFKVPSTDMYSLYLCVHVYMCAVSSNQ